MRHQGNDENVSKTDVGFLGRESVMDTFGSDTHSQDTGPRELAVAAATGSARYCQAVRWPVDTHWADTTPAGGPNRSAGSMPCDLADRPTVAGMRAWRVDWVRIAASMSDRIARAARLKLAARMKPAARTDLAARTKLAAHTELAARIDPAGRMGLAAT